MVLCGIVVNFVPTGTNICAQHMGAAFHTSIAVGCHVWNMAILNVRK